MFEELGRYGYETYLIKLRTMFSEKQNPAGIPYDDILRNMTALQGDDCGREINLHFCRKYGPGSEMPAVNYYPVTKVNDYITTSGVIEYSAYPKDTEEAYVSYKPELSREDLALLFENSVYPVLADVLRSSATSEDSINGEFTTDVSGVMKLLGPGIYLAPICRSTAEGMAMEEKYAAYKKHPSNFESRIVPTHRMERKVRTGLSSDKELLQRRIRDRSQDRSLKVSRSEQSDASKNLLFGLMVYIVNSKHAHQLVLDKDATFKDVKNVFDRLFEPDRYVWFINNHKITAGLVTDAKVKPFLDSSHLQYVRVNIVRRLKLPYSISFRGYTVPKPLTLLLKPETTFADVYTELEQRHRTITTVTLNGRKRPLKMHEEEALWPSLTFSDDRLEIRYEEQGTEYLDNLQRPYMVIVSNPEHVTVKPAFEKPILRITMDLFYLQDVQIALQRLMVDASEPFGWSYRIRGTELTVYTDAGKNIPLWSLGDAKENQILQVHLIKQPIGFGSKPQRHNAKQRQTRRTSRPRSGTRSRVKSKTSVNRRKSQRRSRTRSKSRSIKKKGTRRR